MEQIEPSSFKSIYKDLFYIKKENLTSDTISSSAASTAASKATGTKQAT
jgi:hypothetical protein